MRRWGIVTGGALGLAAVWSVALIVLAFVAPTYGTTTSEATMDGSGQITTGTATAVQVNGPYVVMLLLIPLAATGIVAIALRYAWHPDGRLIAWMVTILLCAFCVVGAMSIGIFVAPIAIALVVACLGARRGPGLDAPLLEAGNAPVR